VRRLRSGLLLATMLAGAAWVAAPAAAKSLPTILTTINSRGAVYKIRPHTLDLAEAAGGTVELTWSSWTRSSATGSGTATASGMGSTTILNVTVKASRVRHGTFTRLSLTTTAANGAPDVERLHVTANGWVP